MEPPEKISVAILEGDEEGLRAVLQEINTSLLNGTCRLPRYYEDIKNWALLNSAKYGSLKIIQIVLEARCNVQTTNEEGNTALSLTCYRSQSIPPCQSYKIAQELLKHGASVHITNKRGETPLMIACAYGNIYLVQLLIEHGSDINQVDNLQRPALWHAKWSNNIFIVEELLNAGAQCIYPSAIDAVFSNDMEGLCIAIEDGCDLSETDTLGDTALHNAVQMGLVTMIEKLLEADCPITAQNFSGDTVLHSACKPNISKEILKMLLNKDKSLANICNFKGVYPIMDASYNCDIETIQILIDAGANLNVLCDNHSPLWDARIARRMDVYKFLLEAGINPLLGDELNDFIQFLFELWDKDSESVIKILNLNKHLKITGFVQIESSQNYSVKHVIDFTCALRNGGLNVHFTGKSNEENLSPNTLTIYFTSASENLMLWLASQTCAIVPTVAKYSNDFSLKSICRNFLRSSLSQSVRSEQEFDSALNQMELPKDVMLYLKYK